MAITICHPVWRLDCGGLEKQLRQVVTCLPAVRFAHIVVTRGAPEPCELPEQVKLIREPSSLPDPMWSRRLALILRNERVNILHIRGLSMLIDSVMAAKLCEDMRVAFSFHGFEAKADVPRVRRRLYREAILDCDAQWAVSQAAAMALERTLGMESGSFEVMHNGVDTDRFAPVPDSSEARRHLALPHDRLVILSIGNLKPIKGHAVLLDAIRRFGSDAGRLCIVLVGRDYLNGAMQQYVAERLPECDVRFLGQQTDIASWCHAADMFVLPSRWEGCSNALLEAMACGLPCVATTVGGNVEIIEDGVSGMLVPADDSEALAAAILSLVADEPRRICLGLEARRQILERFSLSAALMRYADRYSKLAGAYRTIGWAPSKDSRPWST